MPVVKTHDDENNRVDRYMQAPFWCCGWVNGCWVDTSDEISNWLLQQRKDAIQTREFLLSCQKQLGRDGKDLKPFLQDQMRRYRAICIVIPELCHDPLPGDADKRDPGLWPIELAAELDDIFRHIYLMRYK